MNFIVDLIIIICPVMFPSEQCSSEYSTFRNQLYLTVISSKLTQSLYMSSIPNGVAQIQIKRATVKVRQGKIYVGKLPSEVREPRLSIFCQMFLSFYIFYVIWSLMNYLFCRVAQKMTFAHILSSLALLWRYLC